MAAMVERASVWGQGDKDEPTQPSQSGEGCLGPRTYGYLGVREKAAFWNLR